MVFLLLVIIIIIIINFFRRVFSECTEAVATSLIPLVTNFPEICASILALALLCELKKVRDKSTETSDRMLTNFVWYSHEVRAFDTPISSTKAFSL